jgi:hypothetical protein
MSHATTETPEEMKIDYSRKLVKKRMMMTMMMMVVMYLVIAVKLSGSDGDGT